MPRHRRSRRVSFRPSARFVRAFALAAVGVLVLPAMSPSQAVTPQPAVAHVAAPVVSPAAAAEPTGVVAGVAQTPGVAQRPDAARSAGAQAAAVLPDPLDPANLRDYRWPVAHPRTTLPFGPWRDGSRIVGGQPFHDGIDLATFCGDRVVAAHDGVVLAAGRQYDSQMGWVGDLRPYVRRLDAKSLWTTLPIVVVVDDGNGYRSLYAHFGEIVVKRGDEVHAGQLLGYEGQTGHASGCHLHYGLFSPDEPDRFAIDQAVAQHMKLPLWEIARIDPMLVLPPRPAPTPRPSAAPTPSPETPAGGAAD